MVLWPAANHLHFSAARPRLYGSWGKQCFHTLHTCVAISCTRALSLHASVQYSLSLSSQLYSNKTKTSGLTFVTRRTHPAPGLHPQHPRYGVSCRQLLVSTLLSRCATLVASQQRHCLLNMSIHEHRSWHWAAGPTRSTT